LDRIETEATQFFERVQNTYFTLAEQNPDRYRCIDAGQAPKQVKAQVEKVLSEFLQ
ncbi:unnamed protein product, partial [marine sediment metagenome]